MKHRIFNYFSLCVRIHVTNKDWIINTVDRSSRYRELLGLPYLSGRVQRVYLEDLVSGVHLEEMCRCRLPARVERYNQTSSCSSHGYLLIQSHCCPGFLHVDQCCYPFISLQEFYL